MQEHKKPGYVPACEKYKRKEQANAAKRVFVPKAVGRRDFDHRDKVLREIGFESYAAYVKSDLWYSIRRRVMDRTSGQCTKCGRKATVVHHCDYTRDLLLGRGSLKRLWPLCQRCHRFVHKRLGWQTEVAGSIRPAAALPQESSQGSVGPATAPTGE